MRRTAAEVGLAGAVGAILAILAILRPHDAVLGGLRHPHRWVAEVGVDTAVSQLAAAALWCAGAWLLIALATCAATALPGRPGRIAARVARRVTPRLLHRLAAGTAGIGVFLAPVAAGAVTSDAAGPGRPGAPAGSGQAVPAPVWPTDATARATTTARPAPTGVPGAVHRAAKRPAASRRPDPSTTVTVGRGDTLWRIAAARLPAGAPASRIARAWPRWYAANRLVVGADPNLIVPGEVLHAPTAAVEEGSP